MLKHFLCQLCVACRLAAAAAATIQSNSTYLQDQIKCKHLVGER